MSSRSRPFIFFDVGGTLLHFRPSLATVLAASARALGVHVDPKLSDAAVRRAARSAGRGPHPIDVEENRRWWLTFFDEYLNGSGWAASDHVIEWLWHEQQAGRWLTPDDDTIETIRALADAGHRLGIISNWDGTLEPILRRRRLWGFFEVVVSSTAAGVAKPDPAIFETALSAAGIGPDEAVHVGDDPTADVGGARGVGIRPVLLGRRRGVAMDPEIEVIATLADLLALPDIG